MGSIDTMGDMKIRATVVSKRRRNLIGRLTSGYYGVIFCKFTNPLTHKESLDYFLAEKEFYKSSKKGDNIVVRACGLSENPPNLYLKPRDAAVN
jgi:hypothetical protein